MGGKVRNGEIRTLPSLYLLLTEFSLVGLVYRILPFFTATGLFAGRSSGGTRWPTLLFLYLCFTEIWICLIGLPNFTVFLPLLGVWRLG